MLSPDQITGPTAAFLAGLVTSVHCVGMCGPLACAFQPAGTTTGSAVGITSLYHGSRILAYTAIGALAGTVGAAPFRFLSGSGFEVLLWALVVFFAIVALGLEQRIPKPKWVGRLFFRVSVRARKWPRPATAVALGGVTPFLPCGPLYVVFGVAMLSGSTLRGAEFLFAFALGTLPLIWLTHTQYVRFREKMGPVWMRRIQRGTALVLALMIALRLAAGPELVPAEDAPPPACPLCG